MRPPTISDALAAARVLYRVPPDRRFGVLARLFWEADAAQIASVEKRACAGGDGSLMSVALRRSPVPEPSLEDGEFCRCLALVLPALSERQP